MEDFNIVQICEKVLNRISLMDYERSEGKSEERLIFPNTYPSEKTSKIELDKYFRISEQELRFLFVEEFIKTTKLFYSVETPTKSKYRFGKEFESIKIDSSGRSASIDMSIFSKSSINYERIFNIEFKYDNVPLFNFGKDILKLMNEEQSGAFILLLKNTNKGTFINDSKTREGVFNKLFKSFTNKKFIKGWNEPINKKIHVIILSLEQNQNKINPVLIHNKITKLSNIENIFKYSGSENILSIHSNGWVQYKINS